MPFVITATNDGTPEGRPIEAVFIKSKEQLQRELETAKAWIKELEEAILNYPDFRAK